jgi:hypothetical protein
MAIDTSIYGLAKPVEAPSYLDSAQKASNLSNLALQNSHAAQQLKAADMQAHLQKADAFGNALEGLAGLPEEQRAQVYPQVHAELVQSGIISPDQAPSQYDPGFYRQSLLRYRQTAPAIKMQLEKSEIAKNLAMARAAGQKQELALTPGQKTADEQAGKDIADYYYGGGKATVEKNIGRLQGAIDKLQSNPSLTGGISTRIPGLGSDIAQDTINPEMATVRDDIRGAIQGTLKQVLGGQFTEKEGEAIFSRAFNPRLSSAENVKRATSELESLKRMVGDKERAKDYFLAHGTLKGFEPTGTNLQVNEEIAARGQDGAQLKGGGLPGVSEAKAAPVAPKQGAIVDGYVYMGGDPSKPASWKKRSR